MFHGKGPAWSKIMVLEQGLEDPVCSTRLTFDLVRCAHWTAPNLQWWLHRPRRDPPDKFGAGTRAGHRGWPTAGQTEKDSAVDWIRLCSAAVRERKASQRQSHHQR